MFNIVHTAWRGEFRHKMRPHTCMGKQLSWLRRDAKCSAFSSRVRQALEKKESIVLHVQHPIKLSYLQKQTYSFKDNTS